MPVCREQEPPLIRLGSGRTVACHLHGPAITASPDERGAVGGLS
jgi:hypothetical protein